MANSNTFTKSGPPGPAGRRVRNTIQRIRDSLGLYQWLHRQYGPIVAYHVLHLNFCIIFDPDMAHEVLAQFRSGFEKGFLYKRVTSMAGRIIKGEGDEYRKYRTAIQPFFHRKMLQSYAALMAESAETIQKSWQNDQVFDAHTEMYRVFHSIACSVFFGSGEAPLNLEMGVALDELTLMEFKLALVPGRAMVKRSLPRYRHLRRTKEVMDQRVYAAIQAAQDHGGDRNDLITYLVHTTDEQGARVFEDEDVLEIVLEMMSAAHSTSGTALAWLFYFLSRNPSTRERLEQEIDEELGGRRATLEDYDRLLYTRAVIDETLRLGTPAYIIGRTAKEDCVIGGYHLPAGMNVQICSFFSHRDERYFPQPEQFRPERWLSPQPERPQYAYMPFGAGHRSCIGEGMARMAMFFCVISITQHWRLDPVSDQPPDLNTIVAYVFKHGLPMSVVKRSTDV